MADRSRRGLAQSELDVAQAAEAAAYRRGFDPRDDPLAPETRIVDHHHDRLDPVGGTSGDGAAATRNLGKLVAEIGVQPIDESSGDIAAAFVRREPEAIITPERDLHSCAHERPFAIGPTHGAALLGDHAVSLGLGMRGMKGTQRGGLWRFVVRAWQRADRGLSIGPEVPIVRRNDIRQLTDDEGVPLWSRCLTERRVVRDYSYAEVAHRLRMLSRQQEGSDCGVTARTVWALGAWHPSAGPLPAPALCPV